MNLNGAQIVVEQLCKHGATTVFGYPGGSVLPLYDELYKNSDRISHVLAAHEQGAAHAADGYARVAGKTGVVISTSGPGATNLVTGIANAYLDSVPMLAITGNVTVPLLGKDSFQEVDIVGITQPIVKHNFVVREVGTLERILDEAFRLANSGRRGPVLVDIPRSVQTDVCEYGKTPQACEKTVSDRYDLDPVVSAIENSKRPYIYAGGGVLASGAEKELRMLSERIASPVGFSMMGLSALPNDYELNLGMCGMHGKYAASVAQAECDLMLALGVRFSDRATGEVEAFKRGRTIVHVDIDVAEMGKNVSSHIDVCGDVKTVLAQLLPRLGSARNDDWLARICELRNTESESGNDDFSPKNIINTVCRFLDDDSVVATDVGQHQVWVTQYFNFRQPRTLLTSGGLGTMGYGLGAVIGGCIARNRRKTVLFTGDGSFGMNLNELATAVSQELPLVIVLMNNGVLGMVRQWQNMFYKERYSQTTLKRKTDFPALAKAFGAIGHSIRTLSELEQAMENLPSLGPVLLDCHIDMDEKVLPMIPPGGTAQDIITRR